MKAKSTQKFLAAIVVIGILIGLFLFGNGSRDQGLLVRFGILQVEQHASYAALPYEELVNTSDVIFVGKLIEISPSKWNQDSGEYWGEEALQYHTLRFEVSSFIVDKIESARHTTIEITILGPSALEGNRDYDLRLGDDVLVFAGKTDFAWREGGTKSVISLKTAPSLSLFVRKPNGNFEGEALHLLGQGDFATEKISLPLADLVTEIQAIIGNPTSP